MSLPAAWVDRIFERLTLRYGHDFLRRWEGINMGPVKADWAETLAGLERSPDALRYGLDHLPDREAPTAGQFRAICAIALREERQQQGALSLKPNREGARLALDALRRIAVPKEKPRQWARDLKAREDAGETLTNAQRAAWREALGEAPETVTHSAATAITAHMLPPAMRAELDEKARHL
jgi:hypothetical protein